jgi:hypothetical protein
MFHIRFIITYLLFRGNLLFIFRFIKRLLLKREIGIFVQDGFGDSLMGLLIVQNLNLFGFRVKLGLQTLGESSDPNMNLADNLGKNLVFGNYTEDLIGCFSEVEVDRCKDFYAEGWIYGDIRFFRFVFRVFLGSRFISSLNVNFSFKPIGISKPYAVVYLRNNTEEIVDLVYFINKNFISNGVTFNWVLFGENVKDLLDRIRADNFIDGRDFSLKEKLFLIENCCFSVTGRGGFALLPLFFRIETISYFDEQGMNELVSGLWFSELWAHNSFKGPVNGLSADVIWNEISFKYVV